MHVSQALAYHHVDSIKNEGFASREDSKKRRNEKLGGGYPLYDDYEEALRASKPDAVSINTYPETHEPYAVMAFEAGCHVFVEKPLASTVAGADNVVKAAQ